MSRASTELLEVLHNLTAKKLIDVLENGIPILNVEGEVIGREPASAAWLAQATKFLKDNGIEALPTEGSPLGELAKKLPTFSDEDSEMDMPTLRPN